MKDSIESNNAVNFTECRW